MLGMGNIQCRGIPVINARFVRALLLCLLFVLGGCSTRTLKTLAPLPVPDNMSSAQIGGAVRKGLDARHYDVLEEKPGHVKGRYTKDESTSLTVDVAYSTTGIVINYVDSQGMDYEQSDGSARINKHYYRWIKLLRKTIRKELRQAPDASDDTEE